MERLHSGLHYYPEQPNAHITCDITDTMSARLSTEVPRRVVRFGVADVAGRRQLGSASRGLLNNFPRYNMSNYGRRAFRFAGPYVWNSLPEHIRQSTSIFDSCRQALTEDISTPADIAPSALETIVFYCFMGYISALTYYLLLLLVRRRSAVTCTALLINCLAVRIIRGEKDLIVIEKNHSTDTNWLTK